MAEGSRKKTLQTSYVRIAPSFEGGGNTLKREMGKAIKEALGGIQVQLKETNKATAEAAGQMANDVNSAMGKIKGNTPGLDDLPQNVKSAGNAAASAAASAGNKMGTALNKALDSKVSKGIKKVGNGVSKAFGATMLGGLGALGAAGGIAIGKGLNRSLNIEDSKAKLKGLGYSIKDIDDVMNSVSDSVTGTAYGLDEMASVSATALASGVKQGQPLTDYLKKIADTATITGSSVGEIGSIFNKVTANGKLSAEEINQLQDRGLGIGSMLAKQLKVDQKDIKELAAAGKISADDFTAAFSQIDGAAQASGDTVRGAFSNMMAAMGRIGETSLSAVLPAVQPLLKGVTEGLDYLNKNILKPNAERISNEITPKLIGMAQAIGPMMVKIFEKAKPVLEELSKNAQKSFGKLMDNMGELKKYFSAGGGAFGKDFIESIKIIAKGFGDLLAELVPVIAIMGTTTFVTFFQAISVGATILAAILPLVTGLLDFLNSYPGLLTTLTGLFLGLYGVLQLLTVIQTITTFLKGLRTITIASTLAQLGFNAAMLTNPITWIILGIIALIAAIVLLVKNWDVISEAAMTLWTNITSWFSDIFGVIGAWFTGLWENISAFFIGLGLTIGTFFIGLGTTVLGFFSSIFQSVGAFFTAIFQSVVSIGASIITWAQTAIQGVLTWFSSLWTTITTIASTALTALSGALSAAIGFISSLFTGLWAGISSIFNMITSGIGSFLSAIGTGISTAIASIIGVFSNLWNNITSLIDRMRGALASIWDGFINVGKTAISAMLSPVNGLIDMLNGAFAQVNKLRIKMPNGSIFGVNIPMMAHVQLPGLARGGVVSATNGGTPVILGEGGRDEAVTDLGLLNGLIERTNKRLDGQGQSTGNQVVNNIYLTLPEGSNIKEWADKLQDYWEYQA